MLQKLQRQRQIRSCNAHCFGPTTSAENIVEGELAYRTGDWIVFGENANGDGEWHHVNNRGEVESFNNRTGLIEACPNLNCPNRYDYNWDLLEKFWTKYRRLKVK